MRLAKIGLISSEFALDTWPSAICKSESDEMRIAWSILFYVSATFRNCLNIATSAKRVRAISLAAQNLFKNIIGAHEAHHGTFRRYGSKEYDCLYGPRIEPRCAGLGFGSPLVRVAAAIWALHASHSGEALGDCIRVFPADDSDGSQMQLISCMMRRRGLICTQEVAYEHINRPH